jgi:membrane-associated phospholipid phosphatase
MGSIALATALFTNVTPSARAQAPANPAPLFGWRDAAVAVGFGAATLGLFELDKYVAKRSQDKVTQANYFFKDLATPSELLAWPGGLVLEGGLYAFGRLAGHKRTAQVGWHGTEAILLAAGITNVIQKVVGRSRPYVSADTNSRDFKLGGGFTNQDRTSFPSGHTTTAFALAAAVASESRTKWPEQWWSAWLIGPALYGGATVVGLSRLYHNKHWASDVALGALIGTFAGIKVVQYTHDHPDNRFDRIMLKR